MKHIPYPSIEQFRSAIRKVVDRSRYVGKDENGEAKFDHNIRPPILTYRGTVKLHGTNFGVATVRSTDEFWAQSRENIITPAKDNAGSATFAYGRKDTILNLLKKVNGDELVLFGEFCGASIQKGVAITGLEKMFVVFGLKVDGVWQSDEVVASIKDPIQKIYNIHDYPKYVIDIDFNAPELSQNKLVEITNEVEKECPVGKAFGVSGIGEGVVYSCITPGWEDPQFKFKVKGDLHQSSKTTTLAPVDVEAYTNLKNFAKAMATESRCRQAIEKLKEQNITIDRKCLGHYVKWINDDVVKEDTDTAVASGIELQKAFGEINKLAKEWFFAHELEF